MSARHENAATPASLATDGVAALTIGGKASWHVANSTIAPARAIGSIARDMVEGLRHRPRIDGKLSLRWRV
jgi:hypothetical protein